MMELLGPLPTDEKANTWNSYSVYLPSPVMSTVRVELPSMVTTRGGSTAELLLLYSNLNPVIEPTAQYVARTLVESAEPRQSCLGLDLELKYNNYLTEYYLPS